MQVYILTIANLGIIEDERPDSILEDMLNCASVHLTLESAKEECVKFVDVQYDEEDKEIECIIEWGEWCEKLNQVGGHCAQSEDHFLIQLKEL